MIVSLNSLTPGKQYKLQFAGVAQDGSLTEWTNTYTVNVPTDSQPPAPVALPAPADAPTFDNGAGSFKIGWADPADLPPDVLGYVVEVASNVTDPGIGILQVLLDGPASQDVTSTVTDYSDSTYRTVSVGSLGNAGTAYVDGLPVADEGPKTVWFRIRARSATGVTVTTQVLDVNDPDGIDLAPGPSFGPLTSNWEDYYVGIVVDYHSLAGWYGDLLRFNTYGWDMADIEVVSGQPMAQYFVGKTNSFNFTLGANDSLFATPQSSLTFRVYTLDMSRNISAPLELSGSYPLATAPTSLSGAGFPGGISWSWVAPASNADIVSYYEIDVDVNTYDGAFDAQGLMIVGTHYVFTGNASQQYGAAVRAVDVFGRTTAPSLAATASTLAITAGSDVTPPDTPTGLTVNSGTVDYFGSATLEAYWTKPSQPDLFGYYIDYKRASDTNWTTVSFDTTGAATEYYIIRGLDANVSYHVRVSAFDKYNNISDPTATVTRSTDPKPGLPNPVGTIVTNSWQQPELRVSWEDEQTAWASPYFGGYFVDILIDDRIVGTNKKIVRKDVGKTRTFVYTPQEFEIDFGITNYAPDIAIGDLRVYAYDTFARYGTPLTNTAQLVNAVPADIASSTNKIGNQQLTVTWTTLTGAANQDIVRYEIWGAWANTTPTTVVWKGAAPDYTTTGSQMTATFNVPAPGSVADSYSYRVVAFDIFGQKVTTPTTVTIARPNKPTGLTLSASVDKISANWTAPTSSQTVAEAYSYTVKAEANVTTDVVPTATVATVPAPGTNFQIPTVNSVGNWNVAVLANSGLGQQSATPVSTDVEFTNALTSVTDDKTGPNPPTSLTFSGNATDSYGNTSVTLNFTGPTASDLNGYLIKWGPSNSGPWTTTTMKATGTAAPSETFTVKGGGTAGAAIYFEIWAYDKTANYSSTALTGNTTLAALPLIENPATGTSLTPTWTSATLSLTWTDTTTYSLHFWGYQVRFTDGSNVKTFDIPSTAAKSFSLTPEENLATFGTYKTSFAANEINVRALDIYGRPSAGTAITNAGTVSNTVPAAVTPGTVAYSAGNITVPWTYSEPSDFDKYRIVVSAGTASKTYYQAAGQKTFEFPLQENAALLGAQTAANRAAPTISVYAMDKLGQSSSAWTPTIGYTQMSVPVMGTTSKFLEGAVWRWTAPVTNTDILSYYALDVDTAEINLTFTAPEIIKTTATQQATNKLTGGVLHYAKVRAYDVFGRYTEAATSASETPDAPVAGDTTPISGTPSIGTFTSTLSPDGLSANATSTITHSFADVDFSHYIVRYKIGSDPGAYTAGTAESGVSTFITTSKNISLENLVPGSTYYVRTVAIDFGGNKGGDSLAVSFTAASALTQPPNPTITTLTQTYSGNDVVVTFTTADTQSGYTAQNFSGYTVRLTDNAKTADWFFRRSTAAGAGVALTIPYAEIVERLPDFVNDASLAAGDVKLYSTGFLPSNLCATPVNATVVATKAVPAAPTIQASTTAAAVGSITVDWVPPGSAADIVKYNVYAKAGSAPATTGTTDLTYSGLGTSTTIGTTAANTSTWEIRIFSVDGYGQQSAALSQSITPLQRVTTAVADPTITATSTFTSPTLTIGISDATAYGSGAQRIFAGWRVQITKNTRTVSWDVAPVDPTASPAVGTFTLPLQDQIDAFDLFPGADTSALATFSSSTIRIYARDMNGYLSAGSWLNDGLSGRPGAITNAAPLAPTGLTASAGTTTAVLSWTISSTEEDVLGGNGKFNLEIYPDNTYATAPTKTVTTFNQNAAVSGLSSNTTYYARVQAIDSMGSAGAWLGSAGSPVSFATQAIVPDTTPPPELASAPTIGTLVATSNGTFSIPLSWNYDETSGGMTDFGGYNIKWGTASQTYTSSAFKAPDGQASHSYTITGLPRSGSTYYVYIEPRDKYGNIPTYNVARQSSVAALATTISAPSIQAPVWSTPTLVVSWTHTGATLIDAAKYKVELSTDGVTWKDFYVPGGTLKFELTPDLNRATFGTPVTSFAASRIRVSAISDTGVPSALSTYASPISNSFSTVVSAPTLAAGGNVMSATWTSVAGAAGYVVYSDTSNPPTTEVARLDITAAAGTSLKAVWNTTGTTTRYGLVKAINEIGTISTGAHTASTGLAAIDALAVDIGLPTAPSSVAVSTGHDTATGLSYIDATVTITSQSSDHKGIRVRYSTSSSGPWAYTTVDGGSGTQVRIADLPPNAAYYVGAQSIDVQQNVSAFTNASTYPITTAKASNPAAPGSPTLAAGLTSLIVSWTKVETYAMLNGGKYVVELDTVNTFDSVNKKTYDVAGTSSVLTVGGLGSGTTWYARVQSKDVFSQTSSFVNTTPASVTIGTAGTSDGSPPSTSPNTPTVTGIIGGLYVTWGAVTNNDVVTYEVYLSTTNNFTVAAGYKMTEVTGLSTILTTKPAGHTDTAGALAPSTTYYVKIVAKDKDGAAAAGTQGSGSFTTISSSQVGFTADNIGGAGVYYQDSQPANLTGKPAGAGVWYDTNDGYKMWVWNGTAWTASPYGTNAIGNLAITSGNIAADAVIAGKIATDSIVANNIQSNAVTASKIQAGAVTAEKLQIGALGYEPINRSFEYLDQSSNIVGWTNDTTNGGAGAVVATDATAANVASGSKSMRITSAAAQTALAVSDSFPLSLLNVNQGTASYPVFMEAVLRSSSGTPSVTLQLMTYNSSGTLLNQIAVWTGTVTTSFFKYSGNLILTADSNVKTAKWGIKLNTASSTVYVDSVEAGLAVSGTMIADGTITTAKVVATGIDASRITAGTITTDRMTANTINADRLLANTLTADKVQANTTFTQNLNVGDASGGGITVVGAAGYIKSSNYDAGTSGWKLDNSGLVIRNGTIEAAALSIGIKEGGNLVPYHLSDFEEQTTAYANVNSDFYLLKDGTSDVSVVTTNYRTGKQALQVTANAASDGVYLGKTNSDYNIVVEPSTDYIFSMYIRQQSTATRTLQSAAVQIKNSGGVVTGLTLYPSPNDIPHATWTRVYGTWNSGAGATGALIILNNLYTSAGVTTWWIDSVQLEKANGATLPGIYQRPPMTKIDGGKIATQTITATQIAADTITAGNIQAGAITSSELSVGAVDARHIAVGSFGAEPPNQQLADPYGNETYALNWTVDGGTYGDLSYTGTASATGSLSNFLTGGQSILTVTGSAQSRLVSKPIPFRNSSALIAYARTMAKSTGVGNTVKVQILRYSDSYTQNDNTGYIDTIDIVNKNFTAASTWESLSGTGTLPTNGSVGAIRWALVNATVGVNVYFDSIEGGLSPDGTIIRDGTITGNKLVVNEVDADKIKLSSTVAMGIGNLIPNANFDNSELRTLIPATAPWSYSTVTAKSGTYSVRLDAGTATNYSTFNLLPSGEYLSCRPGDKFFVGWWQYPSASVSTDAHIGFTAQDANGSNLSQPIVSPKHSPVTGAALNSRAFRASTRAVSGNIVTITTMINHDIKPGDWITVLDVDATIDGAYQVLSAYDNVIKYGKTTADVTEIATGGSVIYNAIDTYSRTTNVVTVTTKSPHGLLENMKFYTVNANHYGLFQVVSVPSDTSFTYAHTGADIGSTSLSGHVVRVTVQLESPNSSIATNDVFYVSGTRTIIDGTHKAVQITSDGPVVDYGAPLITSTNRSKTFSSMTLTTAAAHNLQQGDYVLITGLGGSGNNDIVQLAAGTTGSTLVYTSRVSASESAADTGGRIYPINIDIPVSSMGASPLTGPIYQSSLTAGTWTYRSATIEAPAGAYRLVPTLRHDSSTAGTVSTNWYFDSIEVRNTMSKTDGSSTTEISPSGVKVFNYEGSELVNLSNTPPNVLSIYDDNKVVASINQDGEGSFQTVNVDGNIDVFGRKLASGLYVYEPPADNDGPDLVGWLDMLPRGIVARAQLANGWSQTVGAGGVGVAAQLSFMAYPNRQYRIATTSNLWDSSAASGTFGTFFKISTPSTPGGEAAVASSSVGTQYGYSYGQSANSSSTLKSETLLRAGLFGTGEVANWGRVSAALLVTSSVAGTVELNATSSGGCIFYIEDVGLDVPNSGTVAASGQGSAYGGAATITKQYTKRYYATASRAYKGDGTTNTYPYPNLTHGYYDGTNGNQRSALYFNNAQIQSDLGAGATIKSVKLYLSNTSWYNGSGGTAIIQTHNYSAVQSTLASISSTYKTTVSNWARGAAKVISLPIGVGDQLKTSGGTVKGIVLGPGPSTNRLYYGTFKGSSYGSTAGKPYIEITYTKTS